MTLQEMDDKIYSFMNTWYGDDILKHVELGSGYSFLGDGVRDISFKCWMKDGTIEIINMAFHSRTAAITTQVLDILDNEGESR